MKHLYTAIALGAISALSLSAQSKIDLQGRIMLERLNSEAAFKTELVNSDTKFSTQSKGVETKKILRLSTIVRLTPGYTAADIEAAGFEVTSDLNSIALVNVSTDDVERLAELDCVRQISFGRTLEKYLDKAIALGGIANIHSGIEYGGKTYSFTGKGVLTGIYDTDLDPNHISFRNTDGTSRVKKLYHYYEDSDGSLLLDDYEDPTDFTTDSKDETHGTHTSGIMAGGYKGDTYWIDVEPEGTSWTGSILQGSNPYHGVSTESDIFMCAGTLDDASSIHAFQEMAKYAQEKGQPCVINYSVGTITGPHDGTDTFSQAVSEVVNQYGVTICAASGNSGSTKSCLEKTFTSSDGSLKTCITPLASYNTQGAQALIDIWADDATPFKLTFNSYKPKYFFTAAKNREVLVVDKADQDFNYASIKNGAMVLNDVLADDYSQAQILGFSEVNEENGRYHVMCVVYYLRNDNFASFIHLNIESAAGKKVVATLANAGEFTALPDIIAGSVEGDDSHTISDVACNPDVISVGAYNNRRYYGTLGGKVSHIDESVYTENGYSYFSSYGTTPDGRQLPEVLGPGLNVIAPFNSYYVAQGYTYQDSEYMQASATDDVKTHYWGAMSGTSMASPFVAGTIGLWLEADPTLTVSDIHEIIAKTSINDEALADSPEKVGYGRINPVGGIKEILSRQLSGLTEVNADNLDSNLIVDQQQGSLSVFVAGENALTATLYTAAGLTAAQAKASGSEATLNTSALASGIYILTVETASGNTATRKVAIR